MTVSSLVVVPSFNTYITTGHSSGLGLEDERSGGDIGIQHT